MVFVVPMAASALSLYHLSCPNNTNWHTMTTRSVSITTTQNSLPAAVHHHREGWPAAGCAEDPASISEAPSDYFSFILSPLETYLRRRVGDRFRPLAAFIFRTHHPSCALFVLFVFSFSFLFSLIFIRFALRCCFLSYDHHHHRELESRTAHTPFDRR